MVDFFYNLKFRIGCNKFCSAWNKLLSLAFNLIYPVYCKLNPVRDGLNHQPRKDKIIVSLTSFPARFKTLHLAIHSIMVQTIKPDKIILWLTEEECSGIELPKNIKKLCNAGLEIRYSSINLKPHNKTFFSFQDFPDAVIISVDDDNVYNTHLVENLYAAYLKHPDCVCCNMAHEISLKDGRPDLYDNWNGGAIGKSGASKYFVALGVGGVLYPPSCFDEDYFDCELIKKMALTADDLWLKFNELRLNVPVYKITKHSKIPFTINNSQLVALGKINNRQHQNDIVINKLCNHYKFNWNSL